MKKRTFRLFILLLSGLACCFNCSSNKSQNISFGIITDIQYSDSDPTGSRYYRNSTDKLKQCIKTLNSKDLDFVIQLGDIIDDKYASYDSILSIFHQLSKPGYHVLGNHDFSLANSYKKSVLNKLGLKNSYYDYKIGSWRFIVLDGNDISFQGTIEGSDKYQLAEQIYKKLKEKKQPNAQKWNGALGKDQLNWLQNKLEKADKNNEKVILFCHFSVIPAEMHNLWNHNEVIAIIEQFKCVKAYINGHNHFGNHFVQKNTHYLTLQGMVETPDLSAFATVILSSDSLIITGYGREPTRRLALK